MYARVTSIRFSAGMRAEVVGVAEGLRPILRQQRGFNGLQVLTDPSSGEGIIIIIFWETQADAEAAETTASYIGQISMMSSFLYGQMVPKTYEVDARV